MSFHSLGAICDFLSKAPTKLYGGTRTKKVSFCKKFICAEEVHHLIGCCGDLQEHGKHWDWAFWTSGNDPRVVENISFLESDLTIPFSSVILTEPVVSRMLLILCFFL